MSHIKHGTDKLNNSEHNSGNPRASKKNNDNYITLVHNLLPP